MMWTDDPVRDADRYAQEQEEQLERRPVCCGCGFHIDGSYGFLIDDKWYCERCIDESKEWFDFD